MKSETEIYKIIYSVCPKIIKKGFINGQQFKNYKRKILCQIILDEMYNSESFRTQRLHFEDKIIIIDLLSKRIIIKNFVLNLLIIPTKWYISIDNCKINYLLTESYVILKNFEINFVKKCNHEKFIKTPNFYVHKIISSKIKFIHKN